MRRYTETALTKRIKIHHGMIDNIMNDCCDKLDSLKWSDECKRRADQRARIEDSIRLQESLLLRKMASEGMQDALNRHHYFPGQLAASSYFGGLGGMLGVKLF